VLAEQMELDANDPKVHPPLPLPCDGLQIQMVSGAVAQHV